MNDKTTMLSPAKRWLVQRMHDSCHGTILNLLVRDGEPIIEPTVSIREVIKLDGKPRLPKEVPREFELKDQHVLLFDFMKRKQNGTITKLSIQDGLPINMEWEAA